MNSFPKQLVSLVAGISLLLFAGVTLAAATKYKPWGVTDFQRAAYEAKLNDISNKSKLIESLRDIPRPILHRETLHHDFGFAIVDTPLSHQFVITNSGHKPLHIEAIKKDQLQNQMQWNLIPEEIAPGDSGQLALRWVPQEESFTKETLCKFSTNDALNPILNIQLTVKQKQSLVFDTKIDIGRCDPGQEVSGSSLVYSQLLTDFRVTHVECDAPNFAWHTEPVSSKSKTMQIRKGSCGKRLHMNFTPFEYGTFTHKVHFSIAANEGLQKKTIELVGRVKTPITFNHPDMRRKRGLDIGTLDSSEEHQVQIQVRLRGESHRELKLVDSKPDELDVSFAPLRTQGVYKLTITVPKGCPTIQFNRDDYRGFMKVGDPDDPQFSNWLPIYGAVVNTN